MKLMLPKQHGSWAMFLVPLFIGIGAGQQQWVHVPLVLGWFLFYAASFPLLRLFQVEKGRESFVRWVFIYFGLGILLMVIPLYHDLSIIWFGFALLPFFLVNIYFAKMKNERAVLNDFSAIASLALGGTVSYYVGTGELDQNAFYIWVFCVLFFMGSVFFVKSLIREKRNANFRWVSWGYHIAMALAILLTAYPLLILAFVPSVVRALFLYGRKLSPKQIGIIEIVNSVYFAVFLMVFIG
ncbi:YwiC-like family protein [Ammoniphilus resinae]|uniref:YwiC-like protein n=1 Tax=Ammoniphilus resinae TaxID=861532 RepID=A0ABS4GR11_9BACL|nr:YwiC-like family protein [Ammoniphilus resinae]MBP1932708.1 hypothetical protein [Ammoniphilus resinae]